MTNKEKTIQFWVLNIASFLSQMGIITVNLSLVYYLTMLKGSPSFIGIASSTYLLTYLLGCLFLSQAYQRYTPRYMVIFSLAGMMVSILAMIFINNLSICLLFLALYGLSMSMLWPQMEAWITRGKDGGELNKATGGFNLSWSFATGIGSYFASFFISKGEVIGLLSGLATMGFSIILLEVVSLLCPGIRAIKGEATEAKEEAKEDHSTTLRFYSWIGIAVVYSVLSIINNIFPLYAQALGLPDSTVGTLLMIRGVTTALVFILLSHTSFWQFKFYLVLGFQLLLAVLCVLCFNAQTPISFAVFFFLVGVIVAFSYDFSIFHSATGAINRSKRMAIHEVMINVGAVLGSLVGGNVYQALSYSTLMLAIGSSILVIALFEIAVYLIRKGKRV